MIEETKNCLEQTVSRTVDTADAADESSDGIEHYRENLHCFRERLNYHEQTVIRNFGFQNASGEDSEGSAEYVIGTGGWRKILTWWQKALKNCDLKLCQKWNF